MAFAVKVLADSLAPCGQRLTTWQVTYPRCIHAEIMTHKMLSKNSASSRAIPTEKLLSMISEDPFIPMYIGTNQKGMQAGEELSASARMTAHSNWLEARSNAIASARALLALNVHKQVVNRLVEPWMWITVIISGTEVDNFFGLRDHEAAEPHFQHLARLMRQARNESKPVQLVAGQWHMPLVYVDAEDMTALQVYDVIDLVKISVGRIARVSYLTHEGKRNPTEDIALHDRLVVQKPLHASPAEHVARAMDFPFWWHVVLDHHPEIQNQGKTLRDFINLYGEWKRSPVARVEFQRELRVLGALIKEMQSGNFYGFEQYRKTLLGEHIGGEMP